MYGNATKDALAARRIQCTFLWYVPYDATASPAYWLVLTTATHTTLMHLLDLPRGYNAAAAGGGGGGNVAPPPTVRIRPQHEEAVARVLAARRRCREAGTLLTIKYETIFQYLVVSSKGGRAARRPVACQCGEWRL